MDPSWTLSGLVGSFVDILLAYLLLCGSFLAFLGSKVCEVFGVHLPCPCRGVFGYRNNNLCLHKLLVESPVRIICNVHRMARSRFPFSPILNKDEASNSDMKVIGDRRECGNELEGESEPAYSSLSEDSSNQSLGQGEDGFSATSIDLSEKSWYSIEESEDSVSMEKVENVVSGIGILRRALEEERAGSAALRVELEKERAAAASASGEAMAMMLRLQTEKGAAEMEAKQGKRLMEEKLAHDEDEMEVLADLVARMEAQNQFLDKELEVYTRMRCQGKDQIDAKCLFLTDDVFQYRPIKH